MENTLISSEIFSKMDACLGIQQAIWSEEERNCDPSCLDRLMHYLISYYDQPSVARKAIRIFLGIDPVGIDTYSNSWDEVRAYSLYELINILQLAGSSNSVELAVTIKDFLHNLCEVFEYIDLDDILKSVSEADFVRYLKQLRGVPNSWKKDAITPYRPIASAFFKHCMKYRKDTDLVLPDSVFQYLEYLCGRKVSAPFEFYSNRFLVRLGLFLEQEEWLQKLQKYNSFLGDVRPIGKHRQIVFFGKVICKNQPRCEICPLNNICIKNINSKGHPDLKSVPLSELSPTPPSPPPPPTLLEVTSNS